MKIIKITTDNEISVHDFPAGTCQEQNEAIRRMIGPRCELYEHVMPKRLYTELGGSNRVGREKGSCVGMLVDEEGLSRDMDVNTVGSYLYEADKHGNCIVGTILIIGEQWTNEGIDFCGISEQQFGLLYPKLEKLVKKARDRK